MTTAQAGVGSGQVYALLKAMHEALSPDNTYLRFFNLSRAAADTEARRIGRAPSSDQVALRWPTPCTTGASPLCCSSTWSPTPRAIR
ncbi:MAG: hypothetical protein ABSB59_33710 [Streptosporangiaceae bacterium]